MAYVPEVSGFIGIGDSPSLDAQGRLRVSATKPLFGARFEYDLQSFLFEAGSSGANGVTPTHSTAYRAAVLTVNAGSGTSYMQSYQYLQLQPGASGVARIEFVFGTAYAGVTKDVGLFDANNGFFFRQNGVTNLQFIWRTATSGSPVDTAVAQDAWNLDRLTGADASDVTLDITKAQALIIDYREAGMGRVRIGFEFDGEVVYAHEFKHSNVLAVPFAQTMNLPVQMLITASASASNSTSYLKNAVVVQEGGNGDFGFELHTPEQTVTAGSGTRTHLIGLRPATTYNSLTMRALLELAHINLCVTGANPVFWELAVGGTFSAGPTWGSVNSAVSGAQYTTAVGTINAVGTIIAAGYVMASNQVKEEIEEILRTHYPLCLDKAGAVRDNGAVHLHVTGIGGTSACRGSLGYHESR